MQLILSDHPNITVRPGTDSYFTVLHHGVPRGAFYYQQHSKQWQGITRSNRLLTPTPSQDDCLQGVIDAMESF